MKKNDILLRNTFTYEGTECASSQATVNWVVDKKAGVSFENGGTTILQQESDENWYNPNEVGHEPYLIIQEAVESFQSQVAHLSDEELMASIEAMRDGRIAPPQQEPKARTKKTPKTAEDEALQQLYNGLTDEEKEALSKKLGL